MKKLLIIFLIAFGSTAYSQIHRAEQSTKFVILGFMKKDTTGQDLIVHVREENPLPVKIIIPKKNDNITDTTSINYKPKNENEL
jgi:hypothetical protein